MVQPWNDNSILPPPINTFLCEENIDCEQLKYITNNIVHILSWQSPFHKESALFSRFLYKFDKKFRNDVGYRNFRKVYTALKKFLKLNLIKDVKSFYSILPNDVDQEVYLPTRQMLEYLLIRIITFSKIMMRIAVCSRQAAIYYLDRIKRGESHWMSLMPYALLSRVWSMIKGLSFLPPKYELPKDLEEWLDMKHLNDFGRFEWTNKMTYNLSSIISEDEDGDLCENILEFVNQINDDSENIDEPMNTQVNNTCEEVTICTNEDTGVSISRKSQIESEPLKLMTSFRETSHLKPCDIGVPISRHSLKSETESTKYDHSIDSITNPNLINDFIAKEEIYRNESSPNALTHHLSFMQWQCLKNSLTDLISVKNRKLQRKIKQIWQEKCLDYK
ncbi:unnamed protein product [Leptidea sinapis]|uniref:Nucleolus and neural progenitor protein-like N-terminal domain-containing protein n=1 Tax=Leptidea sinapis TaxID=189913 RepID=A0A5E4QK90_9NEOP|nr:unnamed protein product [Leptidea sinapis]